MTAVSVLTGEGHIPYSESSILTWHVPFYLWKTRIWRHVRVGKQFMMVAWRRLHQPCIMGQRWGRKTVGSKIKGQGHGGNSTLWSEAYSTRRSAVELGVSSYSWFCFNFVSDIKSNRSRQKWQKCGSCYRTFPNPVLQTIHSSQKSWLQVTKVGGQVKSWKSSQVTFKSYKAGA